MGIDTSLPSSWLLSLQDRVDMVVYIGVTTGNRVNPTRFLLEMFQGGRSWWCFSPFPVFRLGSWGIFYVRDLIVSDIPCNQVYRRQYSILWRVVCHRTRISLSSRRRILLLVRRVLRRRFCRKLGICIRPLFRCRFHSSY